MTGRVKAMWMDEVEAKHVPGVPNRFKLEIVMDRTEIVEAWAFKGRVYCKFFAGEKIRQLFMYRLITPTLDDERAEDLATKVDMEGSVDLTKWEKVKLVWSSDRTPSREELIAEGKRTGICQVCNRKLTNPDSIAAGIGPICAGRI
jgi:hypothetical protein